MLQGALKYLGKSWIGTNSSDKGQCVGLYNQVVLDVSGILYPIQGASGAKDLITAKNTRPDLFQQIKNNPNDPNQLPQVGDWIVWGSTWGGGGGHVACVETVNASGFTSIEQNFVPNTVTRQNHNWSGVIGWVRYLKDNQSQGGDTMTDDTARQVGFNYLGRNGFDGRPNALASPQPDLQGQPLTNQKLGEIFLSQEARNWRDSALPKVYSERDSLRSQVTNLNNQVTALNQQLAQKQSEVEALEVQNASLSSANTALTGRVNDLEQANTQLQQENVAQALEIAQLEEKLKHCPEIDITVNFNAFGLVLWALIEKLGKK